MPDLPKLSQLALAVDLAREVRNFLGQLLIRYEAHRLAERAAKLSAKIDRYRAEGKL